MLKRLLLDGKREFILLVTWLIWGPQMSLEHIQISVTIRTTNINIIVSFTLHICLNIPAPKINNKFRCIIWVFMEILVV